jgi:tRNA modification GTPase
MYPADTIAAISTPCGEGGIGVIRISGPAALSILQLLFKKVSGGGFKSHRFYYGRVFDPATGVILDEALSVCMMAPHSFTREDVAEIQCHSGTIVTQQILSLVLRHGARLADPGEFTRRAFLNGRIDLVQAESVIDIIRGKTETALAVASRQRDGLLSVSIDGIRAHIRQALALVEAYVDFPEEEIGEADDAVLRKEIAFASRQLATLIATFDEGRVLRDGVSVLIAGKPNVGKSSLLNSLLQEKRAIVTSVPGTTRDLIEEVVNINGLPVKLLDTAGIRKTEDPVESEGVRLALERIPVADLILFVLDASRSFDDDDLLVAESLAGTNFILVHNKSDLPASMSLPGFLASKPCLEVSTATGDGLERLKKQIADSFLHGKSVDSREAVFISRVRHRDVLVAVREILNGFPDGAVAGELLAVDLREALQLLGQITGETTPDDILDLIFGQFCIGK